MHPYPRKLVIPPREISATEQPIRSASPNFSVLERDNQSPTSVLSAIGSDTVGCTDSDTPSGSLSPVSSAAAVQSGGLVPSEPNQSTERSASPSPALTTIGSISDEQLSTKLDLFPKENAYAKEGASEEASTRSLKLFGMTVLVTDCYRPSSPPIGTGKSTPADMHEEKVVQALPRNLLPVKPILGNTERAWSHHMLHGAHGAHYFEQCQQENSNLVEANSAAPTPWWTFCGGLPFPFLPVHKAEPSKAYVESDLGEIRDKEVQKEESWTGSNTGSVNDGENGDKCSEAETQRRPFILKNENQEAHLVFQLRRSEESAFSELRTSPEKSVKGFVPYKRCVSERDSLSSTTTGQEREEKQIRLCW
ncbi:hypothetical protein FH972_007756 [Carpinus fangiana]|uniref:Uncharacterized protein n=1 Tax=Carpinus fangiana TaxID=176857 RepID=A0A5N6QWK8_9ROSI|nr:hypothetical protein FH972_007756 [Carpinus fangiana]